MVFFFRKKANPNFQRVFLGFAGGVMVAASIWSLIMPAVDMAEEQGMAGWVPAAGGFLIGAAFLLALDHIIPHLHLGSKKAEGLPSHNKRTTLLVFAVTLHNIPEGLAVGLACGLAAIEGNPATLAAALTLALGMGIQNFPEGAAISLPLRQEGMPCGKAFLYGSLSGIVEPIAGVIGALLISSLPLAMPWLLAFAAGAMVYVVVEELIPEANAGEHSNIGTVGFIAGFVIMMILDVALG
jgi:ZIP family zinc transporter